MTDLVPPWPPLLRHLEEELYSRVLQETPTTEDTVRYHFYLRLMKVGIQPKSMILERPHPNPQLKQKEIDLSVIRPEGMWDFEVKYHRPIPSGHNRPFTQLRGQVVSDLYKLALSDGQRRYSLYITDPEMAAHWERQMGMLKKATRAQPVRLTNEWLARQPKTLRNAVKSGLGFLPENVEPVIWVEASWNGLRLAVWLFGVRE